MTDILSSMEKPLKVLLVEPESSDLARLIAREIPLIVVDPYAVSTEVKNPRQDFASDEFMQILASMAFDRHIF
jgi:hypothetical protein